ncbi:MAG: Hsp33 family molecular chaperone HslO, partial [Oscillospiraceae bacterium]
MPNLIRAISENGGIVVCALDSTGIIREMERIHKTSAVVSAALGRLLTGASLMGTWLKNSQDSLTLRINGGGPIGTLLVVSDGEGNVRGYADHPVTENVLRSDGKLAVGAAVGTDGT